MIFLPQVRGTSPGKLREGSWVTRSTPPLIPPKLGEGIFFIRLIIYKYSLRQICRIAVKKSILKNVIVLAKEKEDRAIRHFRLLPVIVPPPFRAAWD